MAIAGALGSLVHALRSLYWYVGHGELVLRWVPKYFLLPFEGAILGLVFYLVVRGGFLSLQATGKDINPFAFAALAGLVGLFSEQALEKLKKVSETLWTEAPTVAYHFSSTGESSGSSTSSASAEKQPESDAEEEAQTELLTGEQEPKLGADSVPPTEPPSSPSGPETEGKGPGSGPEK